MDNDIGIKLLELQNRIYLSVISEFSKLGIPPILGKMVIDGVAAKISQDTMSVLASQVVYLENELSSKKDETENPKKPDNKTDAKNSPKSSEQKERGAKP